MLTGLKNKAIVRDNGWDNTQGKKERQVLTSWKDKAKVRDSKQDNLCERGGDRY